MSRNVYKVHQGIINNESLTTCKRYSFAEEFTPSSAGRNTGLRSPEVKTLTLI